MNSKKPIILIPIFLIIFFFGLFIGMNDFLSENYNSIIKKTSIDSLEQTKVQVLTQSTVNNLINFKNESDILEKRSEIINYIWKSDVLPNDYPLLVESNFIDVRYNDLENLKTIEKIHIEMKNNVKSIAYLFLPEKSNGKLFIYHQGHAGDFIHGKQTIRQLLISGFSVAAFSMPLEGMNNQPIIELENIGKVKFFKHNQFVLLEEKNFSSLSYFFSPINTTLNYLSTNYAFSDYYMLGISGGGWTSTIYPALDTRISKSFAIAGSIPLSLRTVIDDVGDYEQFHPGLFSITNYFQIYVMNSYGEDREFIQIFNKYDTCCFFNNSFIAYDEKIQNFMSELNYGKFTVVVDDTHTGHKISDHVIELIIEKSL
jgi:hypothetical protein